VAGGRGCFSNFTEGDGGRSPTKSEQTPSFRIAREARLAGREV
jgi:hypothetical protein